MHTNQNTEIRRNEVQSRHMIQIRQHASNAGQDRCETHD
jgi:hypothetical protein